MKKESKQKWITALRSGEYKQTFGRLHSKAQNAYCCLGVLCRTENILEKQYGVLSFFCYEGQEFDTSLGKNFIEDLGLTRSQLFSLILLNDKDLKSFNEIADYIETNIEEE